MTLVERVSRAIYDAPEYGAAQAEAAITVVLKEMYAGRSLDLAGTDYTQRWRDTVKCFAMREGIDI